MDDLGKYEEAIKCYDESIKLNPKYERPWNGKGLNWCIMFYELIKLNRKYEDAWNNQG